MSQQINLYIEETRKTGKDLSAWQMLQGAGLVAAAVLVLYGYIYYQNDALEQQLQAADAGIALQLGKLQQLAPGDAHQQTALTLEQELKQAQADLAVQQKITNELMNGSIGSTRGYSEFMQAFARQVPGGLWLTGFNIEGDAAQMKLSGAALNPELLPVYIMRLNREKAMRGKSFAYLQMQQPKLEAGKSEKAAYLEFVLQSAAASEAEKK